MQFGFDVNKNFDIPIITLCNPNRDELANLANISNLHIKPRFNAVSEVTFDVYSKFVEPLSLEISNLPYYDYISKNRLLHIVGFGYFVIVQTDETNDGTSPMKSVTAYSYEYTLNSKGVNIGDTSATNFSVPNKININTYTNFTNPSDSTTSDKVNDNNYKFYDSISPQGTLLYELLKVVPSWSVGYVNESLCNKIRHFESSNSSLYSFLMEDVEKAYQCIFEFDTENRKINAYTTDEIVKDTDISLSFDNLIKNVKVEETSKDIVTCLGGFGSGELSIREANPLGTNYIYDFSYYTNENWMSKDLIDAITNWDNKVKSKEKDYANHYAELQRLYAERNDKGDVIGGLAKLQTDLAKLTNSLKSKEYERSSWVSQTSSYAQSQLEKVTREINDLNTQINSKKLEVNNKINDIENKGKELSEINQELSLSKNFTPKQLIDLDYFIFESSYTNSNFVVTNRMSIDEEKDMALQLLGQTRKELETLSKPSFTFSMDVVNFLFLEKFKPFIDQAKLGSLIHSEIKRDVWVSPILLEMDISYDNPDSFTMTFGNRYRLETGEWTFKELFDQSKVTNSVSRNYSGLLAPIKNGGLDDQVTEYMNNALNAANQEIISSTNQDVSIGNYGIKCRKKKSDGTFDDSQIMITNNAICMTDNNWQTSKLAIGKNSNNQYGVIADYIVGKLLAGNSLTITDENNTFTVDSKGAKLVNATLEVTDKNGKNRILLDKDNGIKIQKIENGQWKDKFYANNSGNLVLDGEITSTSGTIGGFKITDRAIESKDGNIRLESNGNAKIGLLNVNNNGKASFDGTIQANQIKGQIVRDQIGGNAVGESQIAANAVNGDMVKRDIIRTKHVKVGGNNSRLDTIFADKAAFNTLSAKVANIDNLYVSKTGIFAGECKWTDGGKTSTINQSQGRLNLEADSILIIKCLNEGGVSIRGTTTISGNTVIFGNFIVGNGFSKNCMQNTEHYGNRLINAYETAEYYYGDIGENEVKNGICKVEIDPIFAECVNLKVTYQVFLSPYGKGNIFVSERTPTYFVVEGDNIPFCWELKAKRIGYENTRLEEFTKGGE